MSSPSLTTLQIRLIERLVGEVGTLFSPRDVEAELSASHLASVRSLKYNMTEGCLRAVIYQHMASQPRLPGSHA